MRSILTYLEDIAQCTEESGIGVCETNTVHSAGYLYDDAHESIRDFVDNQLLRSGESEDSIIDSACRVLIQFDRAGYDHKQIIMSLAIALSHMCQDKKVAIDLIEQININQ